LALTENVLSSNQILTLIQSNSSKIIISNSADVWLSRKNVLSSNQILTIQSSSSKIFDSNSIIGFPSNAIFWQIFYLIPTLRKYSMVTRRMLRNIAEEKCAIFEPDCHPDSKHLIENIR
jgi:hypothetical protein